MVQLLVSVRSAEEVSPALTGGADIIDAKEPSRGSLGSVSREMLAAILVVVPPDCPFSVALGDVTTMAELNAAFHGLSICDRIAPVYLKLGFAGLASPARVGGLIDRAVSLAQALSWSPRIVPVAYADTLRAETIPPHVLLRVAGERAVSGVLLDTHLKDGKGLLHWFDLPSLHRWVSAARQRGLVAALAGALSAPEIDLVRTARPDVIGVRGAACEGGRQGRVTAERVRALRMGSLEVSEGRR